MIESVADPGGRPGGIGYFAVGGGLRTYVVVLLVLVGLLRLGVLPGGADALLG